MRRTTADDSRTLPFPPEQVWAVLTDFASYPAWWPTGLRLRVLGVTEDLVGSRFEVRPRGGSFVCEVVRIVPDTEMTVAYIAGVHRGTGVWSLAPTERGTRVGYAVDLEPKGWLVRLLSRVLDFGKIHSRAMQDLFDGLERRAGAHQAPSDSQSI